MTEHEIQDEAAGYMALHKIDSIKEMGKVMGHFKKYYEGTYDGKVLSDTFKKLLP
jgi:uncharacterized protein YqeY